MGPVVESVQPVVADGATVQPAALGGEDFDTRILDFCMLDFKRKNRGKDLALQWSGVAVGLRLCVHLGPVTSAPMGLAAVPAWRSSSCDLRACCTGRGSREQGVPLCGCS